MPKILKSVGIFFIISVISKVFGFGREMVTAYYFGTSNMLDAFLIASMLPLLLFDGVGAALSTSVIPVLSNSAIKDIRARNKFLSSLIISISGGLVVLTVIFIVITPYLVNLVAPGFNDAISSVVVSFTRYMMPIIIFSGIAYIFMAFLQYQGFYNGASLMGMSTSLALILCVLSLHQYYGAYALVIGTVIGGLVQIIVFIPYLKKNQFKFIWHIAWTEDHKKLFRLALPVLLGSLVIQVNITIDRIMASGLEPGSISALNYATKVNTLIIGTTIMAMSSIVFPMFSKLWAEKRNQEFFKSVSSSVSQLLLVMLPICFLGSVLSAPIIRVLFERGAFDDAATRITSTAFSFSVFILIGLCVREILNKALYSMQDSRGPLVGTIVLVVSNIILVLVLVPVYKIAGLPLATSIANIIAVITLIIWFKYKYRINPISGLTSVFVKCLISSIISCGVVLLFKDNLINSNEIKILLISKLVLLVVTGAIIYLVLNILMNERYTMAGVRKLWEIRGRNRAYENGKI